MVKDLYEAQLWAKENTPQNSVFFVTPEVSGSWREFSQRSSYGNPHEWFYTSLVYLPDKKIYDRAVRRASLFGIQFSELTIGDVEKSREAVYGQKIAENLRNRLRSLSFSQLSELARIENIGFLVVDSTMANLFEGESASAVYDSKHIRIFQVSTP